MYLEIATVILGVLMSVGYFPQAYKVYKKKSAEDVSWFSYIIFAIGTATWTIYGIYKHDWIIIASFAIGVLGSWLVLALMFIYRK